jgi:hypothetical protein
LRLSLAEAEQPCHRMASHSVRPFRIVGQVGCGLLAQGESVARERGLDVSDGHAGSGLAIHEPKDFFLHRDRFLELLAGGERHGESVEDGGVLPFDQRDRLPRQGKGFFGIMNRFVTLWIDQHPGQCVQLHRVFRISFYLFPKEGEIRCYLQQLIEDFSCRGIIGIDAKRNAHGYERFMDPAQKSECFATAEVSVFIVFIEFNGPIECCDRVIELA